MAIEKVAVIQYAADQTDDHGNPVSTEPFLVTFTEEGPDLTEGTFDAITQTGDVQFEWFLLSVTEAGDE